MLEATGNNSSTLVTGIFWELFGAASAIAALLRRGFSDRQRPCSRCVGGSAASEFLHATGLPSDIAAFYSGCFEDGAVPVMVRVDQAHRRENIAIDLLKQHGGVYRRNQQLCRPGAAKPDHII